MTELATIHVTVRNLALYIATSRHQCTTTNPTELLSRDLTCKICHCCHRTYGFGPVRKQALFYLFTNSLTHSLTHSLSLTHSFSLTHSLTYSLKLTHSPSLPHSPTHSFSLTQSFIHSNNEPCSMVDMVVMSNTCLYAALSPTIG